MCGHHAINLRVSRVQDGYSFCAARDRSDEKSGTGQRALEIPRASIDSSSASNIVTASMSLLARLNLTERSEVAYGSAAFRSFASLSGVLKVPLGG